LDFESLCVEERLLHVWRWLVDAESNLQSSRRQLDKLRDLRSEELEVGLTSHFCDYANPLLPVTEFSMLGESKGTTLQYDYHIPVPAFEYCNLPSSPNFSLNFGFILHYYPKYK
jgi:hypothetical protein